MKKIKEYIDRFFKGKNENPNYSITLKEISVFGNEIRGGNELFNVIVTIFDFGYVKGYRACKAEQKKGKDKQ